MLAPLLALAAAPGSAPLMRGVYTPLERGAYAVLALPLAQYFAPLMRGVYTPLTRAQTLLAQCAPKV